MSQTPTSDYIMSLPVGKELNQEIDKKAIHYTGDVFKPWSTDTLAAVALWDIIEEHVGTAGIIRVSDAPNIISQMASVGDEKEITTAYTGNWIESLCKAYLLHEYGFYGDYMHPEFKQKMKNAPKRIIQ